MDVDTLSKLAMAQGNYPKVISLLEPLALHGEISGDLELIFGIALAQTGQTQKAIDTLQKTIAKLPGNLMAINSLAICHERAGHWDEARQQYMAGLSIDPNNVDLLTNLGDLSRKRGELDAAIDLLKHALRLHPKHIPALNNLAIVVQQMGDIGQAEKVFREIIELQPRYAPAHCNLGSVLHKQTRHIEAVESYKTALTLQPDYVEALINCAAPLIALGRLADAEQFLARAKSLKPDNPQLFINHGRLAHEKGLFDEAIGYFDRAIDTDFDADEAHWHRSFCRLSLGDYGNGWDDYEYGLKISQRTPSNFHIPYWQGENLRGKTIIINAEQGLGDEIMFASCFQELIDRAGKVVIECDQRLSPIYRQSFKTAEVIERLTSIDPKLIPRNIHYQIPAGSLPRYFRRQLSDFPRRKSFLISDPDITTRWREKIVQLGPGKLVGISWRGGTAVDPWKRSTALNDWLPILSNKNCHFIDLQYGDTSNERETLRRDFGITIHHFSELDPLNEQQNFAALVSSLDLTISVSNATVHLAGALGAPVWSLIPYVASWRWGPRDHFTPWYQSVKIYQQPALSDWKTVFSSLQQDLANFVGTS